MADEETQVREDSLWWAFDASPDDSVSSATFDEPLEWPDTLPWEEFSSGEPPPEGFSGMPADDHDDMGVDLLFPPAADTAAVIEADRIPALDQPTDGSGTDLPTELHLESLPDSIWAADAPADEAPAPARSAGDAAATVATPTFYAEPERAGPTGWRRLLFLRGNAMVVVLISFVSLVLLGMFLAVRARNDVPTRTTQPPVTTDQIATRRPLNTIPLAPATTTATTPGIAITDLLPPSDDTTATSTPATGSGGTVATVPRNTAAAGPAPTAAPTQSATTTPTAPQSTATTAAPPVDTTTVTTTAPVDTTPTSRPTVTRPDITWPSITVTTTPSPTTSWPIPRRDS